jgi:hypothetical protein
VELSTVTVTVPTARVPDLLRHAAQLAQDDLAADGGVDADHVRWTYLGGKSNAWRPMLRHLADHPGEWIDWPDLCDAVDRTARQLAGALGAAERRCKGNPPYDKREVDGGYQFRMDPAVAEIIRDTATENGHT